MVLDQQHADAEPADRGDQRPQQLDFVARQPRRRLVEQQEGRIEHQRAGNLQEAQFAVLQPVGAHVRPAASSPTACERQQGAVAQFAFPRAGAGARLSIVSRKLHRPRTVPPIMTLASTEASPTMRGVWKVRAMPTPARVCGAPGASAAPRRRTAPESGR